MAEQDGINVDVLTPQGHRLYVTEAINDQSRRLEKLNEKLDKKFEDLSSQLRKVENKINFACGGIVVILGVLWFIGQAVLSSYTFNIVPKTTPPSSSSPAPSSPLPLKSPS